MLTYLAGDGGAAALGVNVTRIPFPRSLFLSKSNNPVGFSWYERDAVTREGSTMLERL